MQVGVDASQGAGEVASSEGADADQARAVDQEQQHGVHAAHAQARERGETVAQVAHGRRSLHEDQQLRVAVALLVGAPGVDEHGEEGVAVQGRHGLARDREGANHFRSVPK